ncbi:MAG: hypothetical protein EOM47_01105 [Bacteroidia bacterium]|nr:hypothetical protein [Bacteroidia bacterium]
MKNNTVPDFLAMAKDLTANAQRYAGSESVKFFKESFVKEGFTDSSFKAWPKTSNPMAGKRTMYGKGILMQSVRKTEQNKQRIVVESGTDYSEIQNNGGTITVTAQMKSFFWAKFYELSGKVKQTSTGKVSRSKSNVKSSAKAEFCRRMALMKVGTKIKIPQRQFMGNSQTMMNMFDTFYQGQVDIVFKQHLNNK